MSSMFRIGALSASILCSTSCLAGATWYQYTDLGPSGSKYSQALGINQAGQVAGVAVNSTGFGRAVRWNGAAMTDLGTLGDASGQALALNNVGQAVGWTSNPSPATVHALLWNGTTLTDLSVPSSGDSRAVAVNDKGQVAIASQVSPDPLHAFIWSAGTLTDVGTPGEFSYPKGINSVGQMSGASTYNRGTNYHATRWDAGVPVDLGTLGGAQSEGTAINDAGQVVGWSDGGLAQFPFRHAVIWNGTTPTDLGTLGGINSLAYALNNVGQVVGASYTADNAYHAVVWNGTAITDLNTYLDAATASAGWVLTEARGINDKGQIVGVAYNATLDATHAFMLTPATQPTCAFTYKVTKSTTTTFTAQGTLANQSAAALTGWTASWTYSSRPLILTSKNAKVSVSSTGVVTATPVAATKTIAAAGSVVFSFTAVKGKTVPVASALSAELGGQTCSAVAQ